MSKHFGEVELKRLADWPGVTWDIKWVDDLVGSVGGRMFCCLCIAGPKTNKLSFKVEDARFLELTDRPGFRPAPYLARARWVTVDDPTCLPAEERDALLRQAYLLIRARLPKWQQRTLADHHP